MIILNSPIRTPPSPLFDHLWSHATFKVCADGGANRLYRATQGLTTSASMPSYRPDLITGDLDSLRDETRHYYSTSPAMLGHPVPIVRQYDQDYNDLQKSIRSIPAHYKTVFVYGAFGGRLDQEMASIQTLYLHLQNHTNNKKKPLLDIWLYDDQNAALLLAPGKHVIACPNFGCKGDMPTPVLGEGPTCGLIPLGQACEVVTTRGLQWNLEQQTLAFGALVSTSNRILERDLWIQCSHPLLFSVEVEAGVEE